MTFTKEQLIEHAKRRLNYSRCGCRVSDSDRALDEALMETALAALESRADAEPVAYITYKGYLLHAGDPKLAEYSEPTPLYTRPQPAPVVDADLLHTAASAIEDLLTNKDRNGAGVWYDVPGRLRRAAMLQGKAEQPHSTQHTGWTGNSDADAALVMLDRIDTLDSADDARIEDIKRIIRTLAERLAEPVSQSDELPAKCWCHTCRPVTMADMRFVVCPECGNKRCPHANDHRNVCTGSNEPGQEGSAYPAAPQQEAE